MGKRIKRKMNFRYQRNVKKRAIETAVASIIVCAIMSVSSYYLINNVSDPIANLLGKCIGWLTFFVIVIMLLWSLFLFTRKGNWLIEVTDTFVSWHSPSDTGEKSFQLPICDIKKIICVSSSDVEFEDKYFLLTKTNEQIQLKPTHSGINIHKFIQSLVDNGIEYETTGTIH